MRERGEKNARDLVHLYAVIEQADCRVPLSHSQPRIVRELHTMSIGYFTRFSCFTLVKGSCAVRGAAVNLDCNDHRDTGAPAGRPKAVCCIEDLLHLEHELPTA